MILDARILLALAMGRVWKKICVTDTLASRLHPACSFSLHFLVTTGHQLRSTIEAANMRTGEEHMQQLNFSSYAVVSRAIAGT